MAASVLAMAAARVLHVGDDTCYRIAVMEKDGLAVVRADCSVEAVRRSLSKGDVFSAVTFHNDIHPPAEAVVSTARALSRAPLILFENPSVECNDGVFDCVIYGPMPTGAWLSTLHRTIERAREIRAVSERLRGDCLAVREKSRSLLEISKQILISPIDYDAVFRGEQATGWEPDDEDR